ncbi:MULTISPECIES: ribonuclease III [Legionella]|uniref:Ribonuclease 3 n=1 Tax=Legionella septentrionalis TaxID=2498109 RepID=A0A433JKK3_9GAMM|nr:MULTISPECIES: ribonuclease III [Legionella]MCP0914185.1 ribonuclease III [Legionella sp. 27cVA30]RUQ89272.1 ribonuclease III [Legionella septentrionalis]RUR00639.1 ribonuclease III [Legionella septentrionalis]RUR11880.1 ribonuclease III [Legionella septentrionalis]RUR17593.1 ribonuclease III [Legionella septentrionalis]
MRRLNYTFNNQAYLIQALTHCSAGMINNERLEFLGDSILSFVIANSLFEKFPDQSEGQLSRLRAHLVKGEMLAQIALELQLGDYLYLGQGELKSGGFRRASILADALEAVFAAVFLDGGLDACQQVILKLYESRLNDKNLDNNLKDAKTQLQEFLQAEKYPLPEYTLTKIDGEEHDQIFYVTCEVAKLKLKTQGHGANRRKAEQQAAKQLLQQLKPTRQRP